MTVTASTNISTTSATNSGSLSIKPFSDLLNTLATTAGSQLVKTTDTGQINWASITSSQTGTFGYEIFKLNDSLAATAPLFMKFVYSCAATSTCPWVSVQFGPSSDGAGNLTGVTSTAVQIRGNNSAQDGTARPLVGAVGDGYLTIFGGNPPNWPTSGAQLCFILERLRDPASGAYVTDGITFACGGLAHSASILFTPSGTSQATQGGAAWLAWYSASTFASLASLATNMQWPPVMTAGAGLNANQLYDGTNYYVSQLYPFTNGKLYGAMRSLLIVDFGLFAENAASAVTIDGGSHTYYGTGKNFIVPLAGNSTTGSITTAPPVHTKQALIKFE